MSDSSINLKQAYNEENEAIYVKTSIEGVEGLQNKLDLIDSSIVSSNYEINNIINITATKEELTSNINSLSNKIQQLENENKVLVTSLNSMGELLTQIQNEIRELHKEDKENFNIHLEKNGDKHCVVIENFKDKLKDVNNYRMVFMKKSRHKKKGSYWTVPMFDDKNDNNLYFYDKNKTLLENNKAYWEIISKRQNLWNDKWNIEDLPCVSIAISKNNFAEKLYPFYDNKDIKYKKDQTYIFKNNDNKKLRFGFAIYKKVNDKWERVSNIVEMNLYAYESKKYLINII